MGHDSASNPGGSKTTSIGSSRWQNHLQHKGSVHLQQRETCGEISSEQTRVSCSSQREVNVSNTPPCFSNNSKSQMRGTSKRPLPCCPTWRFPSLADSKCSQVQIHVLSQQSAHPPPDPSALKWTVFSLSGDFCPSSSTSETDSCPPFLPAPPPPPPPLPPWTALVSAPAPPRLQLRLTDGSRKVERGEVTERKERCHLTYWEEQ